jgi:hypothetical protein
LDVEEGSKVEHSGPFEIFAALIWIILGTLAMAFYFFPFIVAVFIRHSNWLAILLINLFFGWSGIGWLGALIMAVWQKERQQPMVYINQAPQPTVGPNAELVNTPATPEDANDVTKWKP